MKTDWPAEVVPQRHRLATFRGIKELKLRAKLHLLPLYITSQESLIVLHGPSLRPRRTQLIPIPWNPKQLGFVGESVNKPRRERNRRRIAVSGEHARQDHRQNQQQRSSRHGDSPKPKNIRARNNAEIKERERGKKNGVFMLEKGLWYCVGCERLFCFFFFVFAVNGNG